MATSLGYYDELKQKYDAEAAAKKAALDAALMRASTAEFDASGNIAGYTYGGGKGPGSLDVEQLETERMMGGGAEAAGMLRSGQYARDLATSQAQYRSRILGMREEGRTRKGEIEADQATKIAEAKAMYETPTSSSGGGGAGGSAPTSPVAPRVPPIAPPPVFSPGTTTAKRPASPRDPIKILPLKRKTPAKSIAPAKPKAPARGGTSRYR